MAWRIHEHVLRGRIDNRARGRVTGEIWLAGIDQPLILELRGDCAPDVAGCELSFENPSPIPMTTKPPGPAGDITAARKVRVFDVPIEEALAICRRGETPPEHMANSLYLEWFSERCGRVVIESADYHLQISEPAWRFTREEIAERDRRVAENETPFAVAITEDGESEWDELRYEQFLRESDARTERYGRLLEKYKDNPDSERIIAREMGWTRLEDALDWQEQQKEQCPKGERAKEPEDLQEETAEDDEFEEELEEHEFPPPDPKREGIDWVRDDDGDLSHPICKRAHDALHALLDELKATGHFPEAQDEQLGDFVSGYMTVSAKLAGSLGGITRRDDFYDAVMVIAWLKRVLEILNNTIAAADAVSEKLFLPPPRLGYYRNELFAIREEILELIARLRGQ
jgi:hypothetical protein